MGVAMFDPADINTLTEFQPQHKVAFIERLQQSGKGRKSSPSTARPPLSCRTPPRFARMIDELERAYTIEAVRVGI